MTQKKLSEIKRRCGNTNFVPAYERLKEESEGFLSIDMPPPVEQAGFYHNYFCPEHAMELVFDPNKPKSHRCHQDGRVYSGEPYDSAWRWFVNNRLSTMAFKLALMWRIDGKEGYLSRAKEILGGYADAYPEYPSSPDKPYGRGRATFQSLDEAVWLIPLVRAYDLIREGMDSDFQQKVEDDLLRAGADHILGQKYFRIHNIECWHNAAIGAVGICLKDSELIRISKEDDFGFHHLLKEGVLDDGLWWEGSTSYHFYALAALMIQAQISEGADRSLTGAERLERMFRAPIDLAYPDLRLPATNDCWFSTSLIGDVCHGVPSAAGFYEVAFGWYRDPVFAWVLHRNYTHHKRDSFEALLYGQELPESVSKPCLKGKNFTASGYAIIRSQEPVGNENYLLLKYGPHDGSHGHPDKLSMFFHVCCHPLSPDLGTPGYGIDLNNSWYRQTLSHNTVIIDGRSQPAVEGKLVAFNDGMAEDFGVADARASWTEEPYEGVSMRRTILWDKDYFLDFFQVDCDRDRQIDWVCRFRGELREEEGLSKKEPVRLEGDGYSHISQPTSSVPNGPVRLGWRISEGGISVFLPNEVGSKTIHGRVPFNPSIETSDILIRRRNSQRATFLALLHPWVIESVVADVKPVHAELPAGVWAIRVNLPKGDHIWIIHEKDHEGDFSVPTSGSERVFIYSL